MKNKEVSVGAIPISDENIKKSEVAKKKMAKNRTMVLLDRKIVNRLCCCKKKIGNTYNSVISNLLDKYKDEQ